MLPSRTTYSDRQIRTLKISILRYPAFKKLHNIIDHSLDLWLIVQEGFDRLVSAVQGSKRWLPVGVWKTAYIEDKVSISWESMFVAERLNQYRNLALFSTLNSIVYELSEVVNTRVTGVYY